MATEVLMPKLGLTMTEGTIEEWKFNLSKRFHRIRKQQSHSGSGLCLPG